MQRHKKLFKCGAIKRHKKSQNNLADRPRAFSILLVPGRIVNESPVKIKSLLLVELLPAIRALMYTTHLDAYLLDGAVAGLGRIADLHRFWHRVVLRQRS